MFNAIEIVDSHTYLVLAIYVDGRVIDGKHARLAHEPHAAATKRHSHCACHANSIAGFRGLPHLSHMSEQKLSRQPSPPTYTNTTKVK